MYCVTKTHRAKVKMSSTLMQCPLPSSPLHLTPALEWKRDVKGGESQGAIMLPEFL